LEKYLFGYCFANFAIAIIEEILLRGLLLKLFEKTFNTKTMLAVIVSSALFGIGHIPGMIQENIFTIIIRVLGTIAVGISLCLIYIKTNNLWTVIILHFLLNCCGSIAYYFSYSNDVYEIARIWPIPMIIVCIINLIIIKIGNVKCETVA
jgi:membrane protease YdiL (CAAX protease family)